MCPPATKVENELSLKLPGRISQDQPDEDARRTDHRDRRERADLEQSADGHLGTAELSSAIGTFPTTPSRNRYYHPHREEHKYQRIIDVSMSGAAAKKSESVTFMTRPDEKISWPPDGVTPPPIRRTSPPSASNSAGNVLDQRSHSCRHHRSARRCRGLGRLERPPAQFLATAASRENDEN
jgi:hypothetical protein